MTYRCEAATVEGFLQQFACCYVLHGYHYYVVGEIPAGKDVQAVDRRIIERFDVDMDRFKRARRKKAGLANAQYIRFKRFFVICATGPVGDHPFYLEHPSKTVVTKGEGGKTVKKVPQIRNIKREPLSFAGYSVGWHQGRDRKWHVSVRIHPERYRDVRAYMLDIATKRSVENLVLEFGKLRFASYAPVRTQLITLLRAVNRERKLKGWEQVPFSCLNLSRKIVRPFGFAEAEGSAA